MEIRSHIVELAKKAKGTIMLPESFDVRTLTAAQNLTKDGVAKVVLPAANIDDVKKLALEQKIDLSGIELIKIDTDILDKGKIDAFIEARSKKGLSKEDALKLLQNPLYFAMMYLKSGKCNGVVCGAVADTSDVLRSSIQVIGTAEGLKLISSYFLMIPPEAHKVAKDPVLFADCAVNPTPDAAGLKDIAIATVGSFKKIFPDKDAKISFLSFSSKGSAKNKVLDKVIEATALVTDYFKDDKNVFVDGELQFDSSVIADIGKRKAPNSKVAGQANILIFPDLNAGNIGYKIAERFGGFQALGPLIQGLSQPVSDLSRGCNAQDIYFACAMMLLK
jgi:phosphate acetyltransferase